MRKLKLAAVLGFAGLITSVCMVSANEETAATEAKEVKCHVRITGSQEWTPRVGLSVSEDAAKVIYGEGTEGVTAIDALVEACYYATYKKDPTIEDLEENKNIIRLLMGETNVVNGWMNDIMGDEGADDSFWMFVDGKTSPAYGIVDYEVTEQSDLWFYLADWKLGYRGYFDKNEYIVENGEAVEIILTGISIENEMMNGKGTEVPLAGTITATGKDKTYTLKCDAEGKVNFQNLPVGEYVLSATWKDDQYGYTLVSPTATIQVTDKADETTSASETTTVAEITTIAETTTLAETTTAVEATTAVKEATINTNIKKAVIKQIKNVKGKKAKLTLKKLKGVTGYQIKYSTSKKFKNSKTIKTKKVTYTINKLNKGKKYYVKVRAYKLVKKQRYYGKWSKVKKVKIVK